MKEVKGTSPYEIACLIIKNSKDEDPFFILDRRDLYKKVAMWRELMPRIKMFYSVKCNDDPAVLTILATQGLCFDVASKGEIQSVLELGVDPSRLLFAQPCKLTSHLVFAKSHGIDQMTFDNEDELHKIMKIYPEARLLLRIRYDGNATVSLGSKFGADPKNCTGLLQLARKLQLNVVGVAFHVGSDVQDCESYVRAIAGCRWVLDQAISLGFTPSILDIGGGFPKMTGDLFTAIAASINQALDQDFPKDGPIEVIAEPGRYIVGTALKLLTKISSRRLIRTSDGEIESVMYYINDGVYGSFNSAITENRIFSNYKFIRKTSTSENDTISSKGIDSIIWGPTCCSLDKVSSSMNLPLLSVGDWIYWPAMGAYTLSIQSSFNGYTKATVQYCMND